jgi:hypothetical protein
MAVGLDSQTDRAATRSAQAPQTAMDEVHAARKAATKPGDPPGQSPSAATPQEINFGSADDFKKLYGPDAPVGAAPVQTARAEVVRAPERSPHSAAPGDASQPVTDATRTPSEIQRDNAEARESLLQAAQKKYKDDPKALEAFKADMNTFEHRMAKSPSEIGHTYQQVERMLDGKSMELPDKDMKKIAGEVMHQAATPQINQGDSEDCLAASLETRLYTRAPAVAAKMMADMSLTGSYRTTDNRDIRLDQRTITDYQSTVALQGQEVRTQASQIMQATLRNVDLDMANKENGTNLRYEVHSDNKTIQALGMAGNGEHIVDYSQNPPKDVTANYPGMRNGYAEEVYQSVAGTNDGGFTLNAYTQVNKDEFKKSLDEMARQGKFPATIGVNLLQEPFKTQGGGEGSALAATIMMNGLPMHAITINSYDPKTGQIEYTNHLSGSQTGTISRDDLFRAMHEPELEGYTDAMGNSMKKVFDADPALQRDHMGDRMFGLLSFMEPQNRQKIAESLSKKLGIDVLASMTDEQRERLGLYHGPVEWIRHQFE